MSAGVGPVCQDVAMLLLGCIAGGFYDGNMFFYDIRLNMHGVVCNSMYFNEIFFSSASIYVRKKAIQC